MTLEVHPQRVRTERGSQNQKRRESEVFGTSVREKDIKRVIKK